MNLAWIIIIVAFILLLSTIRIRFKKPQPKQSKFISVKDMCGACKGTGEVLNIRWSGYVKSREKNDTFLNPNRKNNAMRHSVQCKKCKGTGLRKGVA